MSAPGAPGGSEGGGGPSGGQGGTGSGGSGDSGGSGSGGGGATGPAPPRGFVDGAIPAANGGGQTQGAVPAGPAGPAPVPAPAAAPLPDPAVLAATARHEIPIRIPGPHTSPDGVPQVTGLMTWYWMDRSQWVPATARAELPGIWAEVTATPAKAVWTPGDGSSPVTCPGPGRPHPGAAGATTDCGHTYTDVGSYTIRVAVTYAVTWRSSTGATGIQAPIVLTTNLPVTVEQRQAVTD